MVLKRILVGYLLVVMFSGCGSLGGFPDRSFSVSKKTLEGGIDILFSEHPEYKIPKKWSDLNDWSKNGYDFLESWIFYFNTSPEEMYYVTIVANPVNTDTLSTSIAIRAVNMGHRWFRYDEIGAVDRKRINDRFDKEIIPKLEVYLGNQAKKESHSGL